MSLSNIQDSGGSFIYAGFKSQTQPFLINSSGLIEYKGDRGVLNLNLSESRLVESTIDGATVFQDIVTSTGVSTDLFARIDNVSRSIRTATLVLKQSQGRNWNGKSYTYKSKPRNLFIYNNLRSKIS